MGVFSSRKHLEDIKFSVIVHLLNEFIMKVFVAVAVALMVSVVTVADATLVLKFECPSSTPKMYLTPQVAVANYPSPGGARSVGGCCKEDLICERPRHLPGVVRKERKAIVEVLNALATEDLTQHMQHQLQPQQYR